jgi:hypothetical protein
LVGGSGWSGEGSRWKNFWVTLWAFACWHAGSGNGDSPERRGLGHLGGATARRRRGLLSVAHAGKGSIVHTFPLNLTRCPCWRLPAPGAFPRFCQIRSAMPAELCLTSPSSDRHNWSFDGVAPTRKRQSRCEVLDFNTLSDIVLSAPPSRVTFHNESSSVVSTARGYFQHNLPNKCHEPEHLTGSLLYLFMAFKLPGLNVAKVNGTTLEISTSPP